MRFEVVTLGLSAEADVGAATARVQRWLRPGGTVRLHDRGVETARGRSFEELVRSFAAEERRVTQMQGALEALGFSVDLGVHLVEAEVALVPRDATYHEVFGALNRGVPVLLADAVGPVQAVGLLAWGASRYLRPAEAFFVRHLGDARAHVLSVGGGASLQAQAMRDVLGLSEAPMVHSVSGGLTDSLPRMRALIVEAGVDVVVVAAPLGVALRPLLSLAGTLGVDLLFVPSPDGPIDLSGRLEPFAAVSDARGRLLGAAVNVDAAGLSWAPVDAVYAGVVHGQVVGEVALRNGVLCAPDVVAQGSLGLATDAERPLATLEAVAEVLAVAGAPVVVVKPEVDREAVAALRGLGLRVWALAAATVSPSAVRARTGVDAVLHLGALLAWGQPGDVPGAAAGVVWERGVRRLRALGFPVVATLDGMAGGAWLSLSSEALADVAGLKAALAGVVLPAQGAGLSGALVERCGAVLTSASGHRWLMENRDARRSMIALVDGARERLHLQTYMFEEDRVGRELAAALVRAARRGVCVRLLVDSLWGGHGSLRQSKPLLEALAATEGLTLNVFRPVGELVDLKRRNHRKLVIADGREAQVHGRNVSDHYFTGMMEVEVGRATSEEQVPWLDLSVALTGAVVREADALFLEAWTQSGGDDFVLSEGVAELGAAPLWWVPHRSLAEAATLDAYRVLLDQAERSVTVINTFPLCHELQHALLEVMARGVEVRFLTGHVRPRFEGGAQGFPGSAVRDFMTALIHGRLDPLAAAGARVMSYAVREVPGWAADLGVVLPHVHAKLVVVDDRVAAVGSANLDISSSYWDAEVMLVVEDAASVAELVRWADGLFAGAQAFDPSDAEWRAVAAQRDWLSQSWPSMLS